MSAPLRFSSWMIEQLDLPGRAGAFSKLCWDDINNGCASLRFSANEWMKHFEDKHPDKKDILIERLVNVYGEYLADMEKENA